MKSLINLFLFVCFSAALAISCNPDPCKDTVCGDHGTCNEGACDCEFGYEKDDNNLCNTEWSAKFLAETKPTQDTCYGDNGSFSASYNMTIERKSATVLKTMNLGNFGSTNIVEVNVESPTTLSIDYVDVAERKFTGSGSISPDQTIITLDYVVTYSDLTTDTCTALIMK